MGERVKAMLAKSIKLADQVTEQAGSGLCLRTECMDLRSRAKKLASLLRQATRAELYERPAERIISDTVQALAKADGMAERCFQSHSRLRRFYTLNPLSGLPRTLALLDAALKDVAWLLHISSPRAEADADDDDLRGLPNIAQNEPILSLIWDYIARLHTGSLATRADLAANLASLAREPHYAKLIIEEDGVAPLVMLLNEGTDDGKEASAKALGLLGRDEESVDKLIHSGMCFVFATALKNPPMRVQAAVAEAIATLAHNQKCQDSFENNNAVRHLVSHLASGTIQQHSRDSIGRISSRHKTSPAHMKAMAAKALCKLARGHVGVCKIITESHALLCFARLLEKGDDGADTHLQLYSAMAIEEITRVAEHNLALRQSAFNPSSPAAKAVVEQLLCIVSTGDNDELLLPCITSLGCLSRTFTASETRVIGPLVQLLDDRELPVTKAAVVALTKFVCRENHLHVNHCKAIVNAGGAWHLVQLVLFGDQLQIEALILLCYIALHVPENEELAQAGVLAVLLRASHMVKDSRVEALLPVAKARLGLFQPRGSR